MTTAPVGAPSIPAVEGPSAGWRIFVGLFADAQRAGLPLVPIRARARDEETATSGGDYDLLMPPDGFPALLQLLWLRALEERGSFSVDGTNPHKIKVYLHVPERHADICLEVWTRLEVRDPARRSARSIAWSALEPRIVATTDGPRLEPAVEIANYVSHLHSRSKRVGEPLVAERLAAYVELARRHAPETMPLLEGLTNDRVREAAIAANAHLRRLGVLAERGAVGTALDGTRKGWESARRRRRRRRLERARVIAMTGPDGSGKSTLIERWCASAGGSLRPQRFKGLFRHNPLYAPLHMLRAGATRRSLGRTPPKNLFDEVNSGAMFRIARTSWPWFRVLAAVGGRRCLDRGFPDLLFEGLRDPAAMPALRGDWMRLAARMPQPDWHVHLDAPDEVIRGRKQELSVEALRCYREGMARILGVAPPLALSRLDTSAPVDRVAECLRRAARCLGIEFPWDAGAVIDLSGAEIVGRGNARTCYRHPHDRSRVIKVPRPETSGREQNRIDHYYLAHLEARGVPTTHVPRQHGFVATSLGDGLVLDCITNPDGSVARTMTALLRSGTITREEADVMLDEVFHHLLEHGVVLVDVGRGNLACRLQDGRWRAVVIDGLGGRRFDLRLKLRARVPWLARRKLRAQWPKWPDLTCEPP